MHPGTPRSLSADLLAALRATIPVAMGYVPLGMAFAVLMQQAGAPWWLPLAMSVFVYAGSAQFLAVSMVAGGLSIGEIALATLVVNLRHIFYGVSVPLDRLGGPLARFYALFAVTDETYSLLTTRRDGVGGRTLLLIEVLNQAWWVSGTLLGLLAGMALPTDVKGLEFALVALFIVLTIDQARTVRRVEPFLVAVLCSVVCLQLVPEHFLFATILAAAVLIAGLPLERGRDANQPEARS